MLYLAYKVPLTDDFCTANTGVTGRKAPFPADRSSVLYAVLCLWVPLGSDLLLNGDGKVGPNLRRKEMNANLSGP